MHITSPPHLVSGVLLSVLLPQEVVQGNSPELNLVLVAIQTEAHGGERVNDKFKVIHDT